MMKLKITEQIHERALISEVIGERISLTRRGRSITGLCPFHADKRPSLSVSDEKGIFKCFSCQAGGDAIKFVMDYDKVSFKEAVQKLAKKYQIELPDRWNEAETKPKIDPYKAVKALNAFATEVYHHYLLKHQEAEPARRYLANRGIKLEAIKAFKLGFAPKYRNILVKVLKREGLRERFPESVLETSTLFVKTKDGADAAEAKELRDFFNNRIIFPILNEQHEVLGMGGRALDNHPAKYMNSRESEWFLKYQILYGIREAYQNMVRSKEVFVVEGYLDVIAMQSLGLPAVAPLGTAVTVEQLRKLKRYVQKVYFLFDGDAAGTKAAFHGSSLAVALEMDGGVYHLPQGQDPFDFILAKQGNLADIATYLKTHYTNIYDYLVQEPADNREQSPIAEKEALERLLPVYVAMKDPVVKNIFKEKIKLRFNTDPEEVLVRKRFASILKSYASRPAPPAESSKPATPPHQNTLPASRQAGLGVIDRQLREEELILFLAKHPKLLNRAASVLYPVDLADNRMRFIYEKILHLKNDPNPLPTHVLDLFKRQDVIEYLLKHLTEEKPENSSATGPQEQLGDSEQGLEFERLYCRFKIIQARDRKIKLHLEAVRLEQENDDRGLRENQEALLKVDVEERNFQEFLSRDQNYNLSTTPYFVK